MAQSQGSLIIRFAAGTGETQTENDQETSECSEFPSPPMNEMLYEEQSRDDGSRSPSEDIHLDLAGLSTSTSAALQMNTQFDLSTALPGQQSTQYSEWPSAARKRTIYPLSRSLRAPYMPLYRQLNGILDPMTISISPTGNIMPPKSHPNEPEKGSLGRQASAESVDSFAASDSSPRNAQEFIKNKARTENETERMLKSDLLEDVGTRRSSRISPTKKHLNVFREDSIAMLSPGRKQTHPAAAKVETPLKLWVPPSEPRIPLKTTMAPPAVASIRKASILVESTPSNSSSRSSGLSNPNPISQHLPHEFYPATSDINFHPLNPPLARPASSIDSRSHLSQRSWPSSSIPSGQRSSRSNYEASSPVPIAPSTPKDPGTTSAVGQLTITPTQLAAPITTRVLGRGVASATDGGDDNSNLFGIAEQPGYLLNASYIVRGSSETQVLGLLPAFAPTKPTLNEKGPNIAPNIQKRSALLSAGAPVSAHSRSQSPTSQRRKRPQVSGTTFQSPSIPHLRDSSDHLSDGSLPNVESKRVRKKALRMKRKTLPTRRNTCDSSSEQSEPSEYEDMRHDQHAVTKKFNTLQHADKLSQNGSNTTSLPGDGAAESQISGPVDMFGIKRKRGTYASVSPTKSSRKRARLAASRLPEGAQLVSSSAAATSNPTAFRVFACWPGDKHFYPGTVVAVSKVGKCTVRFDDEQTKVVALSQLRSYLRVGDIVEVMPSSQQKSGQGRIINVQDDIENGTVKGIVTVSLVLSGESIVVGTEHIRVLKGSFWEEDRRIGRDDIPPTVGKIINSPLRLRSRTGVSPGKAEHLATKAVPVRPSAPKARLQSALPTMEKTTRARSMVAGSAKEEKSLAAQLSLSTRNKPFTGVIFLVTLLKERKDELISKIRRGGGRVVDEWEEVISFGIGWKDLSWKSALSNTGIRQIVLLSLEPAETPKYMMALALGVPCVSAQWAWDRLNGFDVHWRAYLHVAGRSSRLSIQVSQVFDSRWGDHDALPDFQGQSSVRKPLLGKTCIVLSSPKDVEARDATRRVICAAGAEYAEATSSPDRAKHDLSWYDFVIMVPEPRSFNHLEETSLVNSQWLKQCIIMGALQALP